MILSPLLLAPFLIGNASLLKDQTPTGVFAADRPPNLETLDITGIYVCEGDNADGQRYRGIVKIEKKKDAYTVTWINGTAETGLGVAIRKGRTLSVSCLMRSRDGAGVAVVVYKVEPGPKLVGRFTELGGDGALRSETLTFVKKLR
jgi:hypothetical protein